MEIVLSGENRYDQYGNFWFEDRAGEEHKVGAKNRKKDDLVRAVVDNPNRAVFLVFDTVKGKDGKEYDYISGIELLELKVDEAKITEQQAVPTRAKPVADSIRENMEWKDAQIEKKFWQGQLGNRIGDGSIDKDFPNSAVKIKGQYYKQMETITGVTFKGED